jgi:hypothetical protein
MVDSEKCIFLIGPGKWNMFTNTSYMLVVRLQAKPQRRERRKGREWTEDPPSAGGSDDASIVHGICTLLAGGAGVGRVRVTCGRLSCLRCGAKGGRAPSAHMQAQLGRRAPHDCGGKATMGTAKLTRAADLVVAESRVRQEHERFGICEGFAGEGRPGLSDIVRGHRQRQRFVRDCGKYQNPH